MRMAGVIYDPNTFFILEGKYIICTLCPSTFPESQENFQQTHEISKYNIKRFGFYVKIKPAGVINDPTWYEVGFTDAHCY